MRSRLEGHVFRGVAPHVLRSVENALSLKFAKATYGATYRVLLCVYCAVGGSSSCQIARSEAATTRAPFARLLSSNTTTVNNLQQSQAEIQATPVIASIVCEFGGRSYFQMSR